MDGQRLDEIAKRFAAAGSRRGMLRLLLVGGAGGVLALRGARGIALAQRCRVDDLSGFEVCRSDDNRTVTYRSGSSWIRFHAFHNRGPFWDEESGGDIRTNGPDYEAARIDVRYFVGDGQICSAENHWDDERNDDQMSSYGDAGLFGTKAIRVVVLCRAQWNGRRISGTVWAGDECFDVGSDPLPVGYPDDWPPLEFVPPPEIIIEPRGLTLYSRPERPTARARVRIRNTYEVDKEVTVGPIEITDPGGSPETGPIGTFENTEGTFTLPPGGEQLIEVTFIGTGFVGSAFARMPVSRDGGTTFVFVEGTNLQVAVDEG
ncbi:MAG: hypothetical protein M3464_19970 [Chloroflexota bacterium]|nr:hypothetical protein [Chloroflexota bacterium]